MRNLISDLITNMALRGATQDELARAIRYSAIVIDAEKNLEIQELCNKYRG